MFVLSDFPDVNGAAERLCFVDPREVVVAETVGEVYAALDRVERCATDGYFAVGYVAYDAAPAFDSALRVAVGAPTPLLWFGIYDAPTPPAPLQESLAAQDLGADDWRAHVTRAEYQDAVDGIIRGIGEGAFYQVNHTVRLRAAWDGDSLAMYNALRAAQPSSYGMYLDIGRFQILSVSPELFFARTGRHIETRPMKGTARRGRWLEEDAAAATALAESVKDRAENVMIVDLVRNDLGRIAELGSVVVPRLFEVERHPTLWQMTSTITAQLRHDVRLPDIFGALFPSGSVVGTPKVAAASWIADHEGAARGVYCGAIGLVRPGGDCVFNVAIRTLVVDRKTATAEYGAGGAITIDSTPVGEYDELMAKAAVLGGAAPAFELLETMRLADGVYVRRERHIRRLLGSASYFDFPEVSGSIGAALEDRARLEPVGDHRVRLLVSRSGVVRTESTQIPPLSVPPGAPLRCVVAHSPVSSRDPFLFHKTTHRAVYDARRAAHPECDEVILMNEMGELTECSIGNLVAELDGERVTPPRECGLLAGVFRDELIAQGRIHERVLRQSDLNSATRVWLVNSLREWVELVLV